MADTRNTQTGQGQPPAGGQQDHDAMRAASMQPVSGGASTDALAASGGLNVPGNAPEVTGKIPVPTVAPVRERIPGERDPGNLTRAQPGGMGAALNAAASEGERSTMSAATTYEREREGGGGDSRGSGKHPHHDAAKREQREEKER